MKIITYEHYKADVLTPEGNWFRTSDEDVPRKISQISISNQGYIFLYKKMTTWNYSKSMYKAIINKRIQQPKKIIYYCNTLILYCTYAKYA